MNSNDIDIIDAHKQQESIIMNQLESARQLTSVIERIAVAESNQDTTEILDLVQEKVNLLNSISEHGRDYQAEPNNLPQYGMAQDDLMSFCYERFDGMPIAAIVGFLEMAKLAIMDDAK